MLDRDISGSKMTIPKAILTVIAAALPFGVVGSVIGGVAGFLLGHFLPGYYRSLFWNGEPNFDAVQVGIGLGVAEGLQIGLVAGVIVGLVIVFIKTRPSP